MADICPIMTLNPIVCQPPMFFHSVTNTSSADRCGAMVHRTINTTAHDSTWRTIRRLFRIGIKSEP